MNPLHQSLTNESYTPAAIVEAARYVMGEINLDPASCEIANQVIQAKVWLDQDSDGLATSWHSAGKLKVFLNPPGGRIKNRSSQALWWDKLLHEYQHGQVDQAIFLAFNDCLVHQRSSVHRFPICWIDETATADCVKGGRICFDQVVDGKRVMQRSPTHGNFIVYLPPKLRGEGDQFNLFKNSLERFALTFRQFGTIV